MLKTSLTKILASTLVICCALILLPKKSFSQEKEYLTYFTKVEVPARFGNRVEEWFNAVERNFNFSSLPKNGSPEKLYIAIKFTVNYSGKISSIYYVDGSRLLLNPVCDLLAKSGKWRPGIIGGREVKSYRDLAMSFVFNKHTNKWEFVRSVDDYNTKEPAIFTRTETIASYISYNEKYWFEFVEREFDFSALPKNDIPDSLVAEANFAVLKDGSIIEISFTNSKELVEPVYQLLLKTYGRWNPAKQGGRDVNSYRRLRLSFKFNKEKSKWKFVRNIKDYMIFPYDR